jgi:hypothetical protein
VARRSKISRLPRDQRAAVDAWLVAHNFADYTEAAREFAAQGIDVGGKSALGRYGQGLERKLAAIKASTDAAVAIAEAAPDDADLRSSAVMSMVQTEIFDVLVALQDAEAAESPGDRVKLLARVAKSVAELSRASVNQKKWAREVGERVRAKVAALEGEASAGKGRLDLATLQRVREELYGIVAP